MTVSQHARAALRSRAVSSLTHSCEAERAPSGVQTRYTGRSHRTRVKGGRIAVLVAVAQSRARRELRTTSHERAASRMKAKKQA